MRRSAALLAFAIVVCFFLVCYGIKWGLPSRWCVDEPVARALWMISAKSIVPLDDYDHPTLHYFILITFLAPYLVFLKATVYPLQVVQKAGSVSWIYLSNVDPAFSTAVYIVARLSSAAFAVLTIYLSYRLAKRCFSQKSGVLCALVLSVTMAFISEAHQAKSTIFLMFMTIATVLSCSYYYDKAAPGKYIVPFLLGGLTLATKYNGGIVIFPLAYYLFIAGKGNIRSKALAPASFLAGFLLGFPGIILKFPSYLASWTRYQARYMPASTPDIGPLFASGVAGYANVLKDAFGIGLFLFISLGLLVSLRKIRGNVTLKLILLIVVPYLIFFAINPKPFDIKYISLVVPFLAIAASGITDLLFLPNRFYRNIFLFLFSVIWLISLKYCLACDKIYEGGDIRYAATSWIKNNISTGRKIVIAGQPEWVVGNEILREYDVSVIDNEPGKFDQKYNRRFIGGRQYQLSMTEAERIAKELKSAHDYYVIYAVHAAPDRRSFWKENVVIENLGIDLEVQKDVKEFSSERSNSFLWRPNIGGYEPRKIIITCGTK